MPRPWHVLAPLLIPALVAAATDTRLADAAKAQDRVGVAALLAAGVDPDAAQPDGATALHWAAHWDDREMAALLTRAGAKPNAANAYGVTPLFLASTNRSVEMVELLLAAGARPDALAATGETVLMRAARTGSTQIVRSLLAHGATVDATDPQHGQTALMFAVAEDHDGVVRALLGGGANVRARSKDGLTPLLVAARSGALNSTPILVDAGAPVNDADPGGATPLLLAASSAVAYAHNFGVTERPSHHETVALFLLRAGADPNRPDALGATPLHGAVVSRKPRLLQALLQTDGVTVNARLSKALPRPLVEVVHNPFKVSLVGATPFLLATNQLDVPAMRMLAAAGADTAATTEDGTTALMAAAGIERGEGFLRHEIPAGLEAVRFVLGLATNDPRARTKGGQTALHGAAYHGANEVIELLLDAGAEVNARDQAGRSAYDVANGMHLTAAFIFHAETVELLRKRGAEVKTGGAKAH